jgi:hypothetical protein
MACLTMMNVIPHTKATARSTKSAIIEASFLNGIFPSRIWTQYQPDVAPVKGLNLANEPIDIP